MKAVLLLLVLVLAPVSGLADWQAVRIGQNTYNSVLRPMSQGVYDPYADKSFLCFMQENSNPYVVECDHAGGRHTWGTPQRVFTQPAASKYNYPTLDILPDRRLVMCFAAPFDNALGFAVSNAPADASAWTTRTVDTGRRHVEYPRIKVDRRGHIYLFYIHMDTTNMAHKRWYYYVKSEDAGQTWSAPVLSLQRELDDPYGMCEMYIGYTVEEPYRIGEPERWWFAFTSSSGFQYQGTHNGADNSPNLVDTTADWGDGGNFYYRWLYNTTKGVNSGIENANATTVFPTQTMDWDNGDAYGIAYHNIYHSHIFVTYFRPDNGHWYDAAHNDLGTTVSRDEIETPVGRPYTSPIPPAGKDVGYVPAMTVNDQGFPTVVQREGYNTWDGSRWNLIPYGASAGDIRYFWFADDQYYRAANRLQVYTSPTTRDWSQVASLSLPNANGFATYSVYIPQGHAEAIMNTHEYNANQPGSAWGISAGETRIPAAIVLRTETPVLSAGTSATVYAFITDKVHGARSRVRGATNAVQLSVVRGSARIETNTVTAVNGLARFTVTPDGSGAQEIVLAAAATGLDSGHISLFVDGPQAPVKPAGMKIHSISE